MMDGIGILSTLPLRAAPDSRSEMVSALLLGERYKVITEQQDWIELLTETDHYKGWIPAKNFAPLRETERPVVIAQLPLQYCGHPEDGLYVPGGALLQDYNPEDQSFQWKHTRLHYPGPVSEASTRLHPEALIHLALGYLNAPYLWGGKTVMGIDCSGLVQILMRIAGYSLSRDAYQQAMQGSSLTFLEEIKTGDLAFFDNEEGKIVHVGIMLDSSRILHASGEVRIDGLDSHGIFNRDLNKHTHQLRFLRRILV